MPEARKVRHLVSSLKLYTHMIWENNNLGADEIKELVKETTHGLYPRSA